ncbi:MAG: flavin reductase family protein [Rhodospirillales bacterium]|nr:flavin reductase family protein [Rhodospirillales bacterium]
MASANNSRNAEESLPDVSPDDFKLGMRQLAASVNVIAVEYRGEHEGLTATAACSISAEPPQLLICVNRSAGAHNLIRAAGSFSLNVLSTAQEDIALRFAGMDGAERSERFGLGVWSELVTGAPLLDGALTNFDCELVQMIEAGTHSVYIGRVVGIRTHENGGPLIYGDARFTGLAD